MDFGSPSSSFPACVPRGRDRPRPGPASQEAGLERLACLPPPLPSRFCAPGLGAGGHLLGLTEPRHLGHPAKSCRHPPLPQPPLGVFIFAVPPRSFLFHFSFRWGLGLPGFQEPRETPADLFVAAETLRPGREPGGRARPAALPAAPDPAARSRWRIHSYIWSRGSSK
ncbi:unnamed protein product [Rangifer tarandus platyrhynchus]|uniref:Uncharacterized protein n=3 Tax=Rangifer tarandus platyrhynchus TaxID=3082113 RepID=A0ABN8Y5C4_RANTA|nr:unnamed protein product [Rangifer tarandus platyrhynchus]CAI9694907.1 unnamed protein product [Rangifer tarandus platyrhynchus]